MERYLKLSSRIGPVPPLLARTLGFQQGQRGSWGEEKKSPENAAQAEKCKFNPLKSPVQKENLVCSLYFFLTSMNQTRTYFTCCEKLFTSDFSSCIFQGFRHFFYPGGNSWEPLICVLGGFFFSSFLPVLLHLWQRTFQLELPENLQVWGPWEILHNHVQHCWDWWVPEIGIFFL